MGFLISASALKRALGLKKKAKRRKKTAQPAALKRYWAKKRKAKKR